MFYPKMLTSDNKHITDEQHTGENHLLSLPSHSTAL